MYENEKIPNNMNIASRPVFPKRAVITAGMPYGNKELHFGHIGGVFIHADFFARFLRDRIGKDNVIFVSGTDCYGAAIDASFQAARQDEGYGGSIYDFVGDFQIKQKNVLDKYHISLDLYGASALGDTGAIHKKMSEEIFNELYESGYLKISKTMQFFDEEKKVYINGRQVIGRCPIQGCKSEFAYADECSLGHQYNPDELINPISTLSGKIPTLKPVDNWYFDLVAFRSLLEDRMKLLADQTNCRKSQLSTINEFLNDPKIYVKKEYMELISDLKTKLPAFTVASEENKASDVLAFKDLDDRHAACKVFDENNIRYRTSKTLVPFRISGNVDWGIPVPEKENVSGLTFWVWPESLWAPISFTQAYLEAKGSRSAESWGDWWKSADSVVYQFIGEDNIYFYGIAEMGIFMALQNQSNLEIIPEDGKMQLPQIIANHHLLFGDKKASSSSAIKPPKAADLLDHYTPEQLRIHFINTSLGEKSVGFKPKVFMDQKASSPKEFDPVLYEGNLLTNVFNRLIRSCFYTAQKYFFGEIPFGNVSADIYEKSRTLILEYETCMYNYEFYKVFEMLNIYLRDANKYWSVKSKLAEAAEVAEAAEAVVAAAAMDEFSGNAIRRQLMIDSFNMVRVAATLIHPIAPDGCEMIKDYLNLGDELWDWDNIFQNIYEFSGETGNHIIKFLEPRVDFFCKHESQFEG
ncbi:MAG: class I tRNA ligase family protein [Saccharofermentanales bacterium]